MSGGEADHFPFHGEPSSVSPQHPGSRSGSSSDAANNSLQVSDLKTLSPFLSFADYLHDSPVDYGVLVPAFDDPSPESHLLGGAHEPCESAAGGDGTAPVTPNSSMTSSSTEAAGEEGLGPRKTDRQKQAAGGEEGGDKFNKVNTGLASREETKEGRGEKAEGATDCIHDQERGRSTRRRIPMEEVRAEGSQEQPVSKVSQVQCVWCTSFQLPASHYTTISPSLTHQPQKLLPVHGAQVQREEEGGEIVSGFIGRGHHLRRAAHSSQPSQSSSFSATSTDDELSRRPAVVASAVPHERQQ
ncbi:hypothetical protein BHE74_00057634 [Ensete ventricosum]|nr:hypothetical protein BHE74_00057634 [Ensete ventricosum]